MIEPGGNTAPSFAMRSMSGGPVAHLATAVIADIPLADVIAPQNEEARLSGFCHVGIPCVRWSD